MRFCLKFSDHVIPAVASVVAGDLWLRFFCWSGFTLPSSAIAVAPSGLFSAAMSSLRWPVRRLGIYGYRGDELKETVRKTLGCQLEVVLRPDESPKKFNVIPLRWIVERSFAWLYNFRRIAMDYEFYSESSEAMIQIAFSKIMLNKLSN